MNKKQKAQLGAAVLTFVVAILGIFGFMADGDKRERTKKPLPTDRGIQLLEQPTKSANEY